ncbi:MAG: ABC transporter permease, partial [Flavobacteriales bacterium]
MNSTETWIALSTIVRKEIRRFMRIWPQTLLPPAITMTLYFVIFGQMIGSRVGDMGGFSYMQFIAPGLIMMAVITNSYSNVVSSFYSVKFQRSIEELIASPVPHHIILIGYLLGGVVQGLLVGLIVTGLSLFFTQLHVTHAFVMLFTVLITAILFS